VRLKAVAEYLKADLILPEGFDDSIEIVGVGAIENAESNQVTFLTNKLYEKYLAGTRAAAVIIGAHNNECKLPQLVHPEPYVAFALMAQRFFTPDYGKPFISEKAEIDESAKIGEACVIHPRVHISEKAVIGDNVVIFPGVFVGAGVEIGDDTVIKANVVLETRTKVGKRVLIHAGAVLGMDGFGFAPGKDGITKIPQVGGTVIEDDVEIGANTTIACGAIGDTVIKNGSKLDSHVHIAHGVSIGSHTMLCGMAAIAGSSKLGSRCIVGGGSMVKDSCTLTDGVILGGHTAVTKSISEPGVYIGFPAAPQRDWQKATVHIGRLQKFSDRLKKLEKDSN
jgi:UDP-3-O-[3-hydroxymyristoyl] glucosamine N-acyltransferase